jgi:DNA-binding winged helix-turn-helix (wHTH) protein
MSDETDRRAGSKNIREPLFAATGAFGQDTVELYEFGPFRLEPAERKLWRRNEVVVLTPKAFDTLVLLVRNSGHLLEKDELIRTLWPDSFVEEGNLTNNISLLRKALGDDPPYVETVPKCGYRFTGAVRQLPCPPARHQEKTQLELAGPATHGSVSGAAPAALSPSILTTTTPTVAAFLPLRKLAAWLSAVAVCIAVGTLAYLKWRQPSPVQSLAAVPLTALPGWADFPAISPDPAVHLAPTWSPDGTQIAFQRVSKDGGGIYIVPAQGGAVRKLRSTNASFDRSMHVSWSPDGKTIAFADSPFPGGHKRLQLLSLETLQSTPIDHDEKCVEEVLPAYSPDGKQLAYACSLASRQGEFGLSVVTAEGRAPRMIRETSGWMKGLEWRDDSKALLFAEWHTGTERGVLRELDLANGSVRDRMVGPDSHFSQAFSANGGRLAYVANSGVKNNIWRGELVHPDAPPVKLIPRRAISFAQSIRRTEGTSLLPPIAVAHRKSG